MKNEMLMPKKYRSEGNMFRTLYDKFHCDDMSKAVTFHLS